MSDEQQIVKGIFLRTKFLVIFLIIIAAIYTITVLGLVYGLRKSSHQGSDVSESVFQNVTVTKESTTKTTNFVSNITTGTPTTCTTTSQIKPDDIEPDYRLPSTLEPYYYTLYFETNFHDNIEPSDYNGSVKISFRCLRRTNQIVLHAKNLEIANESIVVKDIINDTIQYNYKDVNEEKEAEFLIVSLNSYLEAGRDYTVFIKYKGFLTDDLVGFYRSSYLDANRKKRWILASQFEPTDARKAFPCFDEPSLKAKFKITVKHHRNMIAISNMPVMSIKNLTDAIGFVKTEFEETVKMSTYLVAMVISDFRCKQAFANAGVTGRLEVRVCARPSAYDELDFTLRAAVATVEFFQKYFGIEYPLPKLDHVALPDFSAGAMENWGLATYREIYLLYDEKTSSLINQQWVVNVIAHETSHMWFGNLVSPNWWNDLWLNEGFATYMEYFGTNSAYKTFEMYEQFVSDIFHVLELDSLSSSHPLSFDVYNPDEINEFFDEITYIKGGALLRMIKYFISEQTFAKGVTKYLNKYKFSVAKQDYLWKALQEQVDSEGLLKLDISNIMNSWTKQMGYPVVQISRVGPNSIKLTQKHFLKDSSDENITSTKWYIPFSYSRGRINVINPLISKINMSNLYPNIIWIAPDEDTKIITVGEQMDENSFLLGNLDVSGYYRVNYDDNNWNMIIRQLKAKIDAIPIRNRAQLIEDSFNFVKSGDLNITKPLEVIRYLINETEYLPWLSALNHINYILNMIEGNEIYGDFKKYIKNLIEPTYRLLGWNESRSDSWLDRLLRNKILEFACKIENQDCINQAINLYASWMENSTKNPIIPNYRSFVYCTAIRYGGSKEWEFALSQYLSESDSAHQQALQKSMSCSKEPWLIKRYLNDQINETKIRRSDSLSGIYYAASSEYGNLLAWAFFKANWDTLFEKHRTGLFRILSSFISKFNTNYMFEDKQISFTKTRQIVISNDEIKANIRWTENNLEGIKAWLIN